MDTGSTAKKAKAAAAKEEDEEEPRTSAMSHFRKQTGELLFKHFLAATPDMMPQLDGVPSDKRDLMAEIFGVQAFGHNGDHEYMGAMPHGVAEIRMMTDGSCIFFGIPIDAAHGETLQAHYK